MKKLLVSAILLVIASVVKAQTISEGNINFLDFQESLIEVKFDFSNTVFEDGHNYEWWISEVTSKEEWENKSMPYLSKKLLENINDKANDKNMYFTTSTDKANYTMIVAPISLNRKGNNQSKITFYEKDSNEAKVVFDITAKGGKIGSLTNLMGDGFGSVGSQLGKYLKKNVRQKVTKTKTINWGFGIKTSKEKEVIE